MTDDQIGLIISMVGPPVIMFLTFRFVIRPAVKREVAAMGDEAKEAYKPEVLPYSNPLDQYL